MITLASLQNEIEQLIGTKRTEAALLVPKMLEVSAKLNDVKQHAQSLNLAVRANEQFGNYNPQGLYYLEQLIALCDKHHLISALITAYNLKITHLLSIDLNEAEFCSDKVMQILEQPENKTQNLQKEKLSYHYNYIQLCIRRKTNIESAIEIAQTDLLVAQTMQDYNLQCLFLQSISILHSTLGNSEQSIAGMEELILLAIKNKDHNNVAGASGYVAYVYYTIKNYKKAEEKFIQSEHYAELMNNMHATINVVLRKIRMYLETNDLEKVKLSIEKLEPQISKADNVRFNNVFRFYKADYFTKIKEYHLALELLEILATDELYMADLNERMYVFQKMHEAYSSIENFEKAYQYFTKFYDLRFETITEDRVKSMTELQTKYDTERKETQLKQLQIDNLNSELRLLKSQMNPHFMFNAIGSVSNLMQVGKIEEANQSLIKFSRLMRSTLEQSQGDEILIEDEIDFLDSYLHLEKNILGDLFSYSFKVDENIDTSYEKIPSLILQPIVENALKHGLRTKEGEKNLLLHFSLIESEESSYINITIEDNGIGRAASAELNKNRKNHQSFASKSIEERIRIINTTVGFERIKMEVIDLEQGTKVVLTITLTN